MLVYFSCRTPDSSKAGNWATAMASLPGGEERDEEDPHPLGFHNPLFNSNEAVPKKPR